MARNRSSGNPRIYHHLQVAAHRLKTFADRDGLAHAGVTAAQSGAMFVIARTPGATQRDVAKALHQRESAVTTMVSRLIAGGFVRRDRAETDGRAWTLSLTRKGEKALGIVKARTQRMNAKLKAAMGDADHAALARALDAVMTVDLEDPPPKRGRRAK
ncbi:MAG: MarR family winged helix-turn-helix transcriptional regulator [Maricaulaceae bacterium]|jgi:DNA-binding MarR family transcriptional regulator